MFGRRSKLRVPASQLEKLERQTPVGPLTPARARRQRAEREAAWAQCRLVWDGNKSVDGILLDLSDTGARVRFRTRPVIPGTCWLVVPRLRIQRRAEPVRSKDYDVGLRFIDT